MPTSQPKAYEVVLRHVEQGILDGRYGVGDTLPSERDLAERLGVSRAAVREAIRALEAQGVLTSSVGAGAAGGTKVTHARTQALTRLLRLHVALADFPVDEIVELRVSLERTSARLAASALTQAGAEELERVLAAMDATADLEAFNELDTRLHVLVAEAAANSLVRDLTTAVRESLRRPILQAEHRMTPADFARFRARLDEQHRGLVDALAAGDGALAADLVEAHIRSAYAILEPPA